MNTEKAAAILKSPDDLQSLFTDPQLSGFSGKKIIALLQNLATCLDPQNETYLEIGVYRGLSLISVARVFDGQAFGIDNFSQFDKGKKNYNLIREHTDRLKLKNLNLINDDFESALRNLGNYIGGKRIGLLFIDGPHDYRSQIMCLLLSGKYLSKNAVIVIDDSNYRHVRQANADFLEAYPEYGLAFERYTKAHPANMTEAERKNAIEGWWNGINVIATTEMTAITEKKITISGSRMLYYNDHHVHSSRYADCAPEAIAVTHALKPFSPLRLIHRLHKLYRKVRASDKYFHGKYRHLNTYTDDLV